MYAATPETPHAIYELPRARGVRRGTRDTTTRADRLRVASALASVDTRTVVRGVRDAWTADDIARRAARIAFLSVR